MTEAEECQAKECEQANDAPNNTAHDSSDVGPGKGNIRLQSIVVINEPHVSEVGDEELVLDGNTDSIDVTYAMAMVSVVSTGSGVEDGDCVVGLGLELAVGPATSA